VDPQAPSGIAKRAPALLSDTVDEQAAGLLALAAVQLVKKLVGEPMGLHAVFVGAGDTAEVYGGDV